MSNGLKNKSTNTSFIVIFSAHKNEMPFFPERKRVNNDVQISESLYKGYIFIA